MPDLLLWNMYLPSCVTSSREMDWVKAVYWLEKVVNTNSEDEEGDFNSTLDDPSYQLVAREATMYWSGGHGLAKDPNKAGKFCSVDLPR